ncbi:regulator of G-protein signaling loco-like isoform X2 [Biomphalaria glabrata]|uniref:Regulator of G-protein signaling loco-like isoform X2 n=1 Tax=Biomphalaria glabrata TaxID=6526 RepID=A0A9W3BPG6_BIOGL|nr:regulator of G-protein signaling loco-like isoform X2 [Biomphalaria glabrata]
MYPNVNQHTKRRKKRVLQGTKTVVLVRGKVGYGFTISGQNPCMLSCIVPGSPADVAGLKAGDLLYFVNGQNVSKACHDDVVRMVGLSTGSLELQVAENYNSSDSSDDDYPPRSKSRYPNRIRPRVNPAVKASKYERAPPSYQRDRKENQLKHYIPAGAESDLSSSLTSQEDQAWAHVAELAWGKNRQEKFSSKKDSDRYEAKDVQHTGFVNGALQNGSVATAKKISLSAAIVKKVPQVAEIKAPQQSDSEENIKKSVELTASNRDRPSVSPNGEINSDKQDINQQKSTNSAKAVVGYIGSIETPSSHTRPHQRLQALRNAVRRLRLEKRVHTLVLMQVNPSGVTLTNSIGKQVAFYPHERIAFSGICPDDERFFGLVTLSLPDDDCSSYTNGAESFKIPNSSCHIFMIEPELSPHSAHLQHAEAFQIHCTNSHEMYRCVEFPKSPTSLILCIANLYRDAPPRKFDTEIVQSQALADPMVKLEQVNSSGNGNNSNSDSGLGFGREEAPIEQNEQVCIVELPYRMYQLNTSDTSNALDLSNMSTQGNLSPEVDVVNSTASSSSIQRPISAFDIRRGLNNSTSSEECWQQGSRPINKLTPRAMPDPTQPSIKDTLFSNNISTENLRQSMQRLLQARQQQLQEQNCLLGSDGESHAGDPILSLSVADDGHAILEAANVNPVKHHKFVAPVSVPSSSIQTFRSNNVRSAFQVPRPVSAPLSKQRAQSKPETIDVETLGKLSPRAFPPTSPTSLVFRSPSAPPAPFFPHQDSDEDDDDDNDGEEDDDESEDDPYIRRILEQFKKDRNAALEEDNRRLSEGFALSKKREKQEVGNIQKWTKAGSFRRTHQMMLKQSFSHSHESLAVGEEYSNKLITASSVNNISKQTAEQGRIDTAGRVASWAVNFEKLLKDPIGIGIFTEFLKKEFSEENIIFWKACEQYRLLADEHQRKVKAKDIYTRYLSTKASDPVNVDSAARSYSEKYLENPTAIMFDVAQQQIFQLMRQDSYARFLKSDMYKTKLMEEMEGKPLENPGENSTESDGKKKVKGKENDDKRRRSILPWKNSKKSSKASSQTEQKGQGKKEKEASKPQLNVSMASLPSTSTVTNSNGNNNLKKAPGPGIDLSTMRKEVFNAKESCGNTETHFKFCRIVMPDGSTTVVCAKPGQTCRSVLSKLCEKRSISIASVDVFLLGSDKPLDLNEDISTLGSKEIVIERRVLFRLDLPNGKSIGVKAKPNRSIRDVFKPILTKYGYHIDNIGVHFMGFQDFLDLNTSVSELDNQRVVIVHDIDTAVARLCRCSHHKKILRQGVQPVALNPTKVPPANRSKSGHRGGSLEEITNKIFEDLMRGKSQLAHGFDELGVLELDKAKVHKNEEGRYLGLFGLLRKESTAIKDIHKGNKSKGKVTFTLPKSDVKKKVSTKEGERLIDMLSSAQKLRLEEQRGIHVSTGDLPSFLLEGNGPQETMDSLKDSQINNLNQSHPSGVAMFDDIEEISKVGFLEKTKRKEQLNYLGTTPEVVHGNHKMSRDTHKYSDKTVLSDKWKSLTGRSNHDNWTGRSSQPDNSLLNMKNSFSNQEGAVVTSQQTDNYLPMSPLIIDSKNDSHPLHSNGKCSTNARTTQSSPEILSDLNSSNLKTSDRLNSSVTQNSPLKIKVPSDSYTSNKLKERNKTPDPPSYHNAIRTHGVDKKHHPRSTDNVMAHTVNSVNHAENSSSFDHRVLVSPKSDEMIQRDVNDMSRRSLVSPRNDKPPYPSQRNTPLRASSPKLNIGATPSSNFYTTTNQRNSPQSASSHKFHIGATPTSDSHTTTLPNKRSATPVNLRSTGKWDLQFVNSPHATAFTLSPYRDSDHEEETVTFV